MKDYKEKNENNINSLANEIIDYTVFSICISLLSGVQIKCLGDSQRKNKKEKNEIDKAHPDCLKQMPTIYKTFKKSYIKDLKIFNTLPKKVLHNENAYHAISFYKEKNKN
ncbi:conserved Plasmodium protein, unknown function [Plasmodium vinckei vinckei]|uniref:Uncharacterized protein n=1 Tax=Plasmodium vinckei vinckei TaxID=54757 RepID=A0A081IC70_PLAVN|nr:conserved Plasmodium protein, unknown function [Plasmodium vinckei vinckei]KEG01278.1 hypothetical protein YYE_03866 [Plasmodium vinckei vinckei]VEV55255.1 conserved Plasmodium protein, unknown function [Plasmodium vinckei vinckei]